MRVPFGPLWRDLAVQRRVITALMIRETYAKFGRDNLGFGWLFAEPLVFALPVLGMWSLIRAHVERGVPMLAMAWTGYLPILLFRHMGSRALSFARHGSGLLYHRQVTIFDLFAALTLLEVLSNITAMLVSGAILYVLGAIDLPKDPGLFCAGYLYTVWWSVAMGLIIGALSERADVVERAWSPISYMYLPVSGFFYLACWLPDRVREGALLVVPGLHAYEMIRSGLLGPVFRPYYDAPYVTLVLTVLTAIGLKLLRDTHQYLTLE
jgi:capsular polysaccharide transport system permease protein